MSEESINALRMALLKPAQLGNKRIDSKHERFSLGLVIGIKTGKMLLVDYFNQQLAISLDEFNSDKKYARKGTMLLIGDNGLQINISVKDKRIFEDKKWHDKFGYGMLHPYYNTYEKFVFESKHIEIESAELWAIDKFKGQEYLHGSPDKIEQRLVDKYKRSSE
jgi:hypothetical protein